MAKLELEIIGYHETLNSMLINGKRCKLKTNKNNTRTCVVEAEKAEVVIYKTHYYTGKYWFWWNLLFYLISVFGIFDSNLNKRCVVVDCRFNVVLNKDEKVTLNLNKFEDGGKLVDIQTEAEIEEINNIQYFDKEAQKRHKKMKKAKFGIFVLITLIVTLIVVLVTR